MFVYSSKKFKSKYFNKNKLLKKTVKEIYFQMKINAEIGLKRTVCFVNEFQTKDVQNFFDNLGYKTCLEPLDVDEQGNTLIIEV